MVAIKAHSADRYVSSPPDDIRLFLIYGSDPGAITERARAIERVALKRGGGETVLRIGSDELSADPGRIVDEAYSVSLFGGEPVIGLRVSDGRHNVMGALQGLMKRPPDAAWLVVEAAELAPSSPLRKAFEAAKHAAAIPTYPLDGAGLNAFIHAVAEEAGMVIEPAAVDLLSAALGGDRLASRNELEKLFLFAGDQRTIDVDDVLAIVGDIAGIRTDQVIDAALLGESEALEAGLERLRSEGGSAAALGTLTLRHLLLLQTLRVTVDGGTSPSKAVEQARPPIYFRRRAAVEAQLRRWTSEGLMTARRNVDRAIALTRLQPALEDAAISEALHSLALTARRRKRSATQ